MKRGPSHSEPTGAVGGPPGRQRRGFTLVLLAAAGLAAVWLAGRDGGDEPGGESGTAFAGWHHGIDEARAAAAETGRPLLVLFTADWCPPCRTLKRTVLPRPEVQRLLNEQFVSVKIDLSDRGGPHDAVARRYRVGAVPTMLVLDPSGAESARVDGAVDESRLLAWLRRAHAAATGGAAGAGT